MSDLNFARRIPSPGNGVISDTTASLDGYGDDIVAGIAGLALRFDRLTVEVLRVREAVALLAIGQGLVFLVIAADLLARVL